MPELAPPADALTRRGQRLDTIRAREKHISWLIAQQRMEIAALTREDRGGLRSRYVADELAMVWHRSPRQARTRQDDALVFAEFPAVAGLVEQGEWLIDHADAVIGELVGTGLLPEHQQQVLDLVLERRRPCTPWELRASVRSAVLVLFPEHAIDAAAKAKTDRDVRLSADAPGAASLHVFGPAHEVTAIWASVDALCGPAGPEDARTLAQRRFDTLRDLACGRIQPGNWQVQVVADLVTIEGNEDLPGEIVGLGPVPASLAREVAAAGTLRRVAVDEAGRLVAVDATVHRPDQAPAPEPFRQRWDWTLPDPDEHERFEPDPEPPSVDDLYWYDTSLDKTVALDTLDRAVETRKHVEPEVAEPKDEQPEPPPVTPEAEPAVEPDAEPDGQPGVDPELELSERTLPEPDLTAHSDDPSSTPHPVNRPCPTQPSSYGGVWSPEAFTAALLQIRTAPVQRLDLSTDAYVVPKRLKRHLELRDRTCVFPGCPRLAARCEKDHWIPWPRGRTEERNLLDECDHHHHGKHEHFTVTLLPDGTVRWTAPCGLTVDRPPRPVLEHWRFRAPRTRGQADP